VVFETVNANRRHYEAAAATLAAATLAAATLAAADQAWLERLISRRVGLGDWTEVMQRRPNDVKTVIDLTL
jgi:glucose 1-dehydrogenase